MPPLVVFIVGIVAMIFFMTAPLWLALPIVVAMITAALLQFRHVGQAGRSPDPSGSILAAREDQADHPRREDS